VLVLVLVLGASAEIHYPALFSHFVRAFLEPGSHDTPHGSSAQFPRLQLLRKCSEREREAGRQTGRQAGRQADERIA